MQAEPELAATPSMSSCSRMLSPSTPAKQTLRLLGSRRAMSRGPFSATCPAPSRRWRQRRSRSPPTWALRVSISAQAKSSAAASATAPATFSVPARRSPSCPPPMISGENGVRCRTYSAPTPLGP